MKEKAECFPQEDRDQVQVQHAYRSSGCHNTAGDNLEAYKLEAMRTFPLIVSWQNSFLLRGKSPRPSTDQTRPTSCRADCIPVSDASFHLQETPKAKCVTCWIAWETSHSQTRAHWTDKLYGKDMEGKLIDWKRLQRPILIILWARINSV